MSQAVRLLDVHASAQPGVGWLLINCDRHLLWDLLGWGGGYHSGVDRLGVSNPPFLTSPYLNVTSLIPGGDEKSICSLCFSDLFDSVHS